MICSCEEAFFCRVSITDVPALRGIRNLDDTAAFAANIDELSVSEGLVRYQPRPPDSAEAPDTLKVDFDSLYARTHTSTQSRLDLQPALVETQEKRFSLPTGEKVNSQE